MRGYIHVPVYIGGKYLTTYLHSYFGQVPSARTFRKGFRILIAGDSRDERIHPQGRKLPLTPLSFHMFTWPRPESPGLWSLEQISHPAMSKSGVR